MINKKRALPACVVAIVILLLAGCTSGGGSASRDGGTPGASVVPAKTATATPSSPATLTPPPIDVRNGCGPPLPAVYCENWYRAPPSDCPVSTFEVIRSDGLAGTGVAPFWMVIEPVEELDPEPPTKRIWIVADGVQGNVTVRASRLDGPGTITFPLYERDPGGYYDRQEGRTELVLIPPHGLQADHRTEIVYPAAGCWEFTAQIGAETARIVQYIYEE